MDGCSSVKVTKIKMKTMKTDVIKNYRNDFNIPQMHIVHQKLYMFLYRLAENRLNKAAPYS